ncbi:MAG: hypothetical protein PHP54_03850 [Clostridia bacterium]|nr:hypothetical protein [Clostridia bacterium]
MLNKYLDYVAFNSYGGFNEQGDEYHILNTKTPLPWCNVMANEKFGTIISSYGTVYSYYKNSQGFKLTNWCNDWITFEPGEKFTGIFENHYNLVYGFGYVKVLESDEFLDKTMTIFVPTEDTIKIQNIVLENNYGDDRDVTITYQIDPVLGVAKEANQQYILCKKDQNALYFKNPYIIDFSNCSAFCTVVTNHENIDINFNTEEYLIEVTTHLKVGEKKEFSIILGASDSGDAYAKKIYEKYSNGNIVQEEYSKMIEYWRSKVVRNFKLEDKYLNIMANGWLLYQTIVCRLYARSGFYQSGGAIGYRDQLQDTLALISSWPEKTRSQIILHASKQFEKGDVLHWWHEHNNAGIRTYFSDDYLWLAYVLCEYIDKTQDISILDVETNFLEDKAMGDKRELYDIYSYSEEKATVYEHAKRAILYGLSRTSLKNGLLDIGDGDWNDGFSNIRGQSVWLTLFMMNILDKFSKVAKIKNDEEMVKTCEKQRHLLKHSIVEHTWDKDHFVRAFFENGDVLGSYSNNECKVDLISQTWAVISMKNDTDMQEELKECMKTADKYLVDKEHGIIRLLYPSFNNPKNNPGYIKAYVPGTRENGGQYTHAATWLAKAYFDLKDDANGMEILKMLSPISHSDTKEKANTYMVEPYVIAADIYTNPEHVGRGGWTWYTGSAAWMYKVIEDYLSDKK